MKTRLFKQWEKLRSSFWFLPALMAAGAACLALGMVALDQAGFGSQPGSWFYTGGPDGASLLLGTVAGSMITIAGTVFSMTLVALSLASSQLGPRLLWVFMRDTANQVVLGTFLATFVYCLLVLRTIRRGDGMEFVPHLSVTVGVALALASLAVLIHFIHHVSVSIQADHVVARVGAELIEGVDRLFPEQGERPARPVPPGAADQEAGAPVVAGADGYLQLIDDDALLHLALREDLRLRVLAKPGDYFVRGQVLLRVLPPGRSSPALDEALGAAFLLGNQRSPAQDIDLLVERLVEIAVRALSPGVNDPFTAIACLDRLASGLCRLATREIGPVERCDESGLPRLTLPRATLPGLFDAAFDPIRQACNADAAVLARMLHAIAMIAAFVRHDADRDALRRHAQMVGRAGAARLPEASDRVALQGRLEAAMAACAAGASAMRPADDAAARP